MSAYIYAKRQGKKWVGVARWAPKDGIGETCIAIAEDAFSKAGYPNLTHTNEVNVSWESQITKQKNYVDPITMRDISYITVADARAYAEAKREEWRQTLAAA